MASAPLAVQTDSTPPDADRVSTNRRRVVAYLSRRIVVAIPCAIRTFIARGGTVLVDQTISPTSSTTEPNRAGCGTSTNASATVLVDTE
jgi:hypothetical protein